MDLNIKFDNENDMEQLATLIADKLAKQLPNEELKLKVKTKKKIINFDEFRKIFCHGKGKNWVKDVLFTEYPEIVDPEKGFVSNYGAGKGKHIKVNFYKAKRWFEEHDDEILWDQPSYA